MDKKDKIVRLEPGNEDHRNDDIPVLPELPWNQDIDAIQAKFSQNILRVVSEEFGVVPELLRIQRAIFIETAKQFCSVIVNTQTNEEYMALVDFDGSSSVEVTPFTPEELKEAMKGDE